MSAEQGAVYKFGNREMTGTESVSSAQRVERIADVCATHENSPQFIVVAGPRPLTSILERYNAAHMSRDREADSLREEAVSFMDETLFPMFDDKRRASMRDDFWAALMRSSPDSRHYFPAVGHQKTAQYITALIAEKTGEPVSYHDPEIVFGNLGVDRGTTRSAIRSSAERMQFKGDLGRVVIAGGYGDHLRRDMSIGKRSLGYKGADRTAAFWAAELKLPLTIFSAEKDGLYSGDPDYVENALLRRQLTRHEVRATRSSSLQENIIKDINGDPIPITLRSLDDLDNPGTLITVEREVDATKPVALVASETLQTINIYQNGIGDEVKRLEKMAYAAGLAGLSIRAALGMDDYQSLAFSSWVKPAEIAALADKISGDGAVVETMDLGVLHVVGAAMAQDEMLPDQVEIDVRRTLLAEKIKVFSSQRNIHSDPVSPSMSFFVEPENLHTGLRSLHKTLI